MFKIYIIFRIALIVMFLLPLNFYGQNSMVGDGFGGRMWYKPYNYTVGSYSAYTVCGDSCQLFGWGGNATGQLGDGTYDGSAIPVKIQGMNNVKFYSTGYLMGAIKKDNTGWIWGNATSKTPKKVIDDVRFLDVGIECSVFIKNNGTVWCAGINRYGSFGTNKININSTDIPEEMRGINNAVRVSSSLYSTVILLSNGKLAVSGTNSFGILGINANTNYSALEAIIIPSISNIVDIKSNTYNTIALDKNGDVFVWGAGSFGCNGNGGFADNKSPQKINSLSNIVAISGCSDGYHFLALDVNHNCYAWGNWGSPSIGSKILSTPTIVATEVNDIMAGETFSYIVKKDGSLWACGGSESGSIWLNLNDQYRADFTQIDPTIYPLNLCKPLPSNLKSGYQEITICQGESINVLGNKYSFTGTYLDTVKNASVGDSIIITNLKVLSSSSSTQHYNICAGESVTIGSHIYKDSGIFRDTFINYLGCDSIVITAIEAPCRFKLFNVFTPNNDGTNDQFEISGNENMTYDLSIYNRWGVVVYTTSNSRIQDKSIFWNGKVMNKGKECPAGTYYYIFSPDKTTPNKINGVLELIR